MQTLADLAARLRAAVTSQAYAEAQALVPLYCSLLESEFRAHPPASPEARRIAEDARELYQWLARSATADREQCAAQLRQLATLSAYLQFGTPTAHTYVLEG